MTNIRSSLSFAVGVLLVASLSSLTAPGQSAKPPASSASADRLDYEVQLYLLLAANEANEANEKANVPQSLDPVIKQLRSSLSFTHYRLAATFVNRVKDGGTLESRGLVPSNLFTPANATPLPQAVYEFTLTKIKADDDLTHIDINRFRFGLQIPVITGTARAEGNTQPIQQINYQPATINTEINFREGTPTVVGTMNTSRSDQILVLIVTVKRVQ
jgi:hypothetical protein